MIEISIKILLLIGILYTHLEAYKMGKIQGQRDYFNFFNNGKKAYKNKNKKWNYIKAQKYQGRRYQDRKGNKKHGSRYKLSAGI